MLRAKSLSRKSEASGERPARIKPTPTRRLVLGLAALLFIAGSTISPAAEPKPDRIPISWSSQSAKHAGGRLGSQSTGATGWWFGSAGIALILAACGGVSIAARKYLPQSSNSLLKVVGRVSLSPKHSVYLLRVDDRVLLIGAGPQGAPSYLGEMSDTTDDAGARGEFLPATQPLPSIRTVIPAPKDHQSRRLDVRLGDEE